MAEFFAALFPERMYENFRFSSEFLSLDILLAALYVGIIVAAVLNCYRHVHLGRAVRGLIAKEAFDPEHALPAGKGARHLGRAVKRGTYGKLIAATEDGRFYIPEEKRYEAEVRYEKKGNGVGSVIAAAIILIPVFLLVRWLVPELLTMLDNSIGFWKS